MSQQKGVKQTELNLLTPSEQLEMAPTPAEEPVTWNQFSYKEQSNAPKIMLSGLSMIVLSPILMAGHIRVSEVLHIPIVQFCFVSVLIAFLINYTAIIRRYELRPFLPEPLYDRKLKWISIFAVVGFVASMFWGWNGSGGIIFAMAWEYLRGNRFGLYGWLLIIIIAGSLAMQDNLTWHKFLRFIPGILFGSINSTLFTLRESSMYAIAHQFLLLTAVTLPILFPISHIIVPNIWQWLVMGISGITLLFTTLITIKLMQTQRVSVVMGVLSGLLMIFLCPFDDTLDIIGAVVAIAGVGLVIKKHYFDIDF